VFYNLSKWQNQACSFNYVDVRDTGLDLTPLRKNFAANLKRIRALAGMTQEELAEKLDISVRYVQLLESKKCPDVKLDTLYHLAKALGVKPAAFLKD
jgi:DNA-binding Xre family transcriptional regulator